MSQGREGSGGNVVDDDDLVIMMITIIICSSNCQTLAKNNMDKIPLFHHSNETSLWTFTWC